MPDILVPQRNCWRIAKANRFALLVDGSNYYGTLAEAIELARQSIAIVGWDLDTRVSLVGEAQSQQRPPLQQFFRAVVSRNPQLHMYILNWRFPMVFANVREPQLVLGQDPFRHPHIHFKFDGEHPPGASHHQKIVVIDDRLAFCGGMDIAGGRWDTPEHRANDDRRGYPPAHDVQAMVDGDVATALAEIVHDRWQRASGASMPWSDYPAEAWPVQIAPDLTDVLVGISRTDPGADGRTVCHEIEQLHLDLIATAREVIYIENQYLTSDTMVNALCCRLQEPDGPEVLIVLPLKNSGWLEEHTIEVLRFQSIERLRAMDSFKRLRICYPIVPDLDGESVAVHSKILVVDDRLFRVGSSNLTNRSMRLDTECDLTIEAENPAQRAAIAKLRNRLLGEHLGLSPESVAQSLSEHRSLIQLVDCRSGAPRCLRQLHQDHRPISLVINEELVDPKQPLSAECLFEAFASSAVQQPARRLLPLVIALIGIAVVVAVGWRKNR